MNEDENQESPEQVSDAESKSDALANMMNVSAKTDSEPVIHITAAAVFEDSSPEADETDRED